MTTHPRSRGRPQPLVGALGQQVVDRAKLQLTIQVEYIFSVSQRIDQLSLPGSRFAPFVFQMNPNAHAFCSTAPDASPAQGIPLDDEHAVTSLAGLFPKWNRKHLLNQWVASGRDWDSCVREISLIESEISGVVAPPVAGIGQKGHAGQVLRPQPTPVWKPSPTAPSEFPELGSSCVQSTSKPASSWAQKAKENIGAPASAQSRPGPPGFRKSTPSSGSSAAPARDIWESSGIHQVSTGGAVSSQYANAREDARTMAIARNKLFEEATRAFQRGDKKLAKELGARGRELNETMHALHEHAAQGIFEARNSGMQSNGGRRVVDCHGLHAREGVSKVMQILDDAKRRGNEPEIDIVVGTGSHSKTNSGVLRRAVVDAIGQAGYRYRENYAGLLTVYL